MSRFEQPGDSDSGVTPRAAQGLPATAARMTPRQDGGLRPPPPHMRRRHGLLLATAAVLALAACEPGTGPFASSPSGSETTAAKPSRSTRIVDRDVEAPQIFQVTDEALWDGRPSLGGVWVASPGVTDPERVIMRNPANGKFVIGALFKREQDNPGPQLQISSDAAEALGLLAGQPAKLSVTALRREEQPETAPAAPVLDSNESLAAATAPADAGPLDAGGVTTTALAAPGAGSPGATPAASGTKKTKAQIRREAKEAAAAEAKAAGSATQPAAGAAAASVTAAAPAAQPAPAAKPAAAPAASGSGRSIQIGFFSQEANATRAQSQLSKAGVAAQIRKESSQGKDYWSVFTRGDGATLKKIKSAGFADAYMLK